MIKSRWLAAPLCTMLLCSWLCTQAAQSQAKTLGDLEPGRYIYSDPKTGKTRTYYVPHPGGTKLDPTLPEKLLPDELLPQVLQKTMPSSAKPNEPDKQGGNSESKPESHLESKSAGTSASNPEVPAADDSPRSKPSSANVRSHSSAPKEKPVKLPKPAEKHKVSSSDSDSHPLSKLGAPFSWGGKAFRKLGAGLSPVGKGMGAANSFFFGEDGTSINAGKSGGSSSSASSSSKSGSGSSGSGDK